MIKKFLIVAAAGLLIMSCGNGNNNNEDNSYETEASELFEDAISEDVAEDIEDAVEGIGNVIESIENLEAVTEDDFEEALQWFCEQWYCAWRG